MLLDPDRIRLQHMFDAAAEAVRLATGRGREDLNSHDFPLTYALVHLVSVVGEAASKVSADTRSQLDDIPWPDIIVMRNRLVHAYFDINLDILWETVQSSLPTLVEQLTAALAKA